VRWLGRVVTRRRRWVIALALAFLPVAGIVGGSVERHLSAGGFDDPSSDSSRAAQLLRDRFHTGEPNLVLLVTARTGSVDAPAVASAGTALTGELAARPGISEAASYWTLGAPGLRSRDGTRALVLARIGGDEDAVNATIASLAPQLQRSGPVIAVGVAGEAEVFRQIQLRAKQDLGRAEALSFPLTLIVLIAVFGGVVAAGLPLAVRVLTTTRRWPPGWSAPGGSSPPPHRSSSSSTRRSRRRASPSSRCSGSGSPSPSSSTRSSSASPWCPPSCAWRDAPTGGRHGRSAGSLRVGTWEAEPLPVLDLPGVRRTRPRAAVPAGGSGGPPPDDSR